MQGNFDQRGSKAVAISALTRISHKKLGNKSESIRKFRDHNKTQRKNFDFHESNV